MKAVSLTHRRADTLAFTDIPHTHREAHTETERERETQAEVHVQSRCARMRGSSQLLRKREIDGGGRKLSLIDDGKHTLTYLLTCTLLDSTTDRRTTVASAAVFPPNWAS